MFVPAEKIEYALANSKDGRLTLEHVYNTGDGHLVASNGIIMAIVPIATVEGETVPTLVPADAIKQARKLKVKHLDIKDGRIYADTGHGILGWDAYDAAYPDFETILHHHGVTPDQHAPTITLDVDELVSLTRAITYGGKLGIVNIWITNDISQIYVKALHGRAVGVMMPASSQNEYNGRPSIWKIGTVLREFVQNPTEYMRNKLTEAATPYFEKFKKEDGKWYTRITKS